MAFREFQEYGAASRPEATLRTSGYLFLSKGIMKRAGLENATATKLLFDEETDMLGIKLFVDSWITVVDENVKEASVEKSGIAVNLTPLLRYYGLPDPKDVGKHTLPVKFEGGMIVIDLSTYRHRIPTARKLIPDFDSTDEDL